MYLISYKKQTNKHIVVYVKQPCWANLSMYLVKLRCERNNTKIRTIVGYFEGLDKSHTISIYKASITPKQTVEICIFFLVTIQPESLTQNKLRQKSVLYVITIQPESLTQNKLRQKCNSNSLKTDHPHCGRPGIPKLTSFL